MAQVEQLKCPSCGAPLPHDRTKCEFCGTELLLVPGGLTFQMRQGIPCPKCSRRLGDGSWYCVKCGYVVPEHKERVLELQKKQRFLQEDVRRSNPELANSLELGEFLYFTTGMKDVFYAATEKGLIIKLMRKAPQRYPWSEVVAIGDVAPKESWGATIAYSFEVQTFNGTLLVEFPTFAIAESFRFHTEVIIALGLHNSGEKDVRQVILSLRPDGPP